MAGAFWERCFGWKLWVVEACGREERCGGGVWEVPSRVSSSANLPISKPRGDASTLHLRMEKVENGKLVQIKKG